MRSLYVSLALIFLFAWTPCMSYEPQNDLPNVASELDEMFTSAYAAYKIATWFNSTAFKPDPTRCWVCTLLMTTFERFVNLHSLNIDDYIMNHICPKLPKAVKPVCNYLVKNYGPTIIAVLLETESPDAVCTAIGLCDYPQCTLIPKGEEPKLSFSPNWMQYFQVGPSHAESLPDDWLDVVYTGILVDHISRENSTIASWVMAMEENGISPINWIKELINKMANEHLPLVDLDGDEFSEVSSELRGYNWRGRDCNDNDKNVYPGRKTNPYPGFTTDYNCNGISGIDALTGEDYKESLCSNSSQLGVVVMGDSAGAHCEVPTQWVNASAWDSYTLADLIKSLADEIDLPHMSAYTGYTDTGYTGPVSSVYKYLYERNKCNFRDYQNIAVNGLSIRNAEPAIIRIARNQSTDHPVLVFLELIGNDVCGGHEDFNHWTTVDEFRTNLIKVLDTLDTLLPAGSHLVAVGLANGSLIFEGVNNRMHPVGVTYNQLYDFQNCLGASLCWGWLNTNATIRADTTQRAADLSQVYSEVFANYTAQNFDMAYYDFPTQIIWDQWVSAGNDPYLLIEPVDGFHPSQVFNAMLGDYLWNALQKDHPDWLGEENPNNARIAELFGNQGGY